MSALLIGYARYSTDQQDLTPQRDGLTGLGIAPAVPDVVPEGFRGTSRSAGAEDTVLAMPGTRREQIEQAAVEVT